VSSTPTRAGTRDTWGITRMMRLTACTWAGRTATLERRVRALEAERTARRAIIDWRFTSRQARVKLKKVYPVVRNHLD